MAAQENMELTFSYSYTKSIPMYRARLPKEGLRADWTVYAQQKL